MSDDDALQIAATGAVPMDWSRAPDPITRDLVRWLSTPRVPAGPPAEVDQTAARRVLDALSLDRERGGPR